MTRSRDKAGVRVVRSALLAGMALLLSYVESLVGLGVTFLPGLKPGLANLVITFAFFELSAGEAAAISCVRVVISGMLFGTPLSFLYAASGAVCAYGGLWMAGRLGDRVSFIGVSVLCAALHGVGQMLVAVLFFGLPVARFYLPYLLLGGVAFGALTGLLLNLCMGRYQNRLRSLLRI